VCVCTRAIYVHLQKLSTVVKNDSNINSRIWLKLLWYKYMYITMKYDSAIIILIPLFITLVAVLLCH